MNTKKLLQHSKSIAIMMLGSIILSTSICIFYSPNNLLSGGVWGMAMLSEYLLKLPTGLFIFLYNLPLMFWAGRELDKRFVVYTVITILFQSIIMLILPDITPKYSNNPLLACIFGGVLVGFGNGIILRAHGSGGGLDIVGLILKKKIDVSVGNVVLVFNIIIVSLAAFIYGFEPAMYTMVSMYINSVVFNKILRGFNPKRSVMIITDKGLAVSSVIMEQLGRGVTVLKAEGAYSHQQKDVLISIVSRYEVPRIKELIKAVDDKAFVSIVDTNEVMGSFKDVSVAHSIRQK